MAFRIQEQIVMFLFILFVLHACDLGAQIPATLSYQGLLTDSNGTPVPDGTHTILVKFYDASEGGTATFQRGPITVITFKGLFTVILGSGEGTSNDPLPSTFGDSPHWIGITPDNQTELTPRATLTTVPYAFRALYANTGVPIGTIVAYASSTIPDGWLECDGSAVSRISYSELFTAIGITWGAGDATTTFNLPDLRGSFLRGWDHGAGSDPDIAARTAKFTSGASGDNVGSYQGDQFKSHTHLQDPHSHGVGFDPAGTAGSNRFTGGGSGLIQSASTVATNQYTGGNETRPKNAYVAYIIKAQ